MNRNGFFFNLRTKKNLPQQQPQEVFKLFYIPENWISLNIILGACSDEYGYGSLPISTSFSHNSFKLPEIFIDSKRIRQVLDNIIDNSIKYSETGTSIIVGAIETVSEVEVSIVDQGIGIPEHELERVFERMFRADHSLSIKVGGAGLGLALCRGIVEAHNDRIWMQSNEGNGITCFFTLPKEVGGGGHER